jgi:hypothetical protein
MPRKRIEFVPVQFIGEEITTIFDKVPMLSKKPGPPSVFKWRDGDYRIIETISAWFDYERKGRATKNMREENLREAKRRGSWGVGRYYYRVRTDLGRVFDLYYDRAPKDAGDRKGHWFLWREMEEQQVVGG